MSQYTDHRSGVAASTAELDAGFVTQRGRALPTCNLDKSARTLNEIGRVQRQMIEADGLEAMIAAAILIGLNSARKISTFLAPARVSLYDVETTLEGGIQGWESCPWEGCSNGTYRLRGVIKVTDQTAPWLRR